MFGTDSTEVVILVLQVVASPDAAFHSYFGHSHGEAPSDWAQEHIFTITR